MIITFASSRPQKIAHSRRCAVATLAVLLGGSTVFSGEPIGQFHADFGFGITNGPPPGFTYIVFQHDFDVQPIIAARPTLFDDIRVSPSVVGQEFFVSPETDPDFTAFANKLTNGVDERVVFYHFTGPGITGPGTGFPLRESQHLGAAGWPDLIGRTITSMSMRVNSYTSDGRFDYVDVTVTAHGVPEPSSLAIMFGCMISLSLVPGRRYQRKPTVFAYSFAILVSSGTMLGHAPLPAHRCDRVEPNGLRAVCCAMGAELCL